nr:hypothetical protein [Tepidanaerobacter acetatoxydans]
MLEEWFKEHVAPDILELRAKMMKILQEENKLMDIVKLVGEDVLPDEQRIILEIAKIIKSGYLQQNAYHAQDAYAQLVRQYKMLKVIDKLYERASSCIKKGIPISKVKGETLFSDIIMMKYNVSDDKPEVFENLNSKIDSYYDSLESMYKEGAADESKIQKIR